MGSKTRNKAFWCWLGQKEHISGLHIVGITRNIFRDSFEVSKSQRGSFVIYELIYAFKQLLEMLIRIQGTASNIWSSSL